MDFLEYMFPNLGNVTFVKEVGIFLCKELRICKSIITVLEGRKSVDTYNFGGVCFDTLPFFSGMKPFRIAGSNSAGELLVQLTRQ